MHLIVRKFGNLNAAFSNFFNVIPFEMIVSSEIVMFFLFISAFNYIRLQYLE